MITTKEQSRDLVEQLKLRLPTIHIDQILPNTSSAETLARYSNGITVFERAEFCLKPFQLGYPPSLYVAYVGGILTIEGRDALIGSHKAFERPDGTRYIYYHPSEHAPLLETLTHYIPLSDPRNL